MPSLFRIGATVRSANKPAVGDNTYVEVTKVAVKREGDLPKRGPWW
ncbi:hypothetical protein [Streptomyces albidoflavus]|nr:hypothetical protein [Streptomyces albidoflavus]